MKCPKCGMEIENGVTVCPSCGFSITMDDGTPAQTPVVEAPVVPDNSPVVEAPKVETPAVDAPKVEAPAVEAPVVDAPVVDAPVVDAPVVETPKVEETKVEAPLVDAPSTLVAPNSGETLEQTKETPAAPAAPAPVMEEVTHAESVASASTTVVETPQAPAAAPVKEKKNIMLYVIIGVLAILAVVLVVLLLKNGANSAPVAPLESKATTNTNTTPDIKEKTPTMEEGFITLNNVKFSVPQNFSYEYLNEAYSIFNLETSDKRFILENMYVGTAQDIEQYLNMMKVEYPNIGCTDIVISTAEKDGYSYGIAEYVYQGIKYQEMFVLLDGKFVVVFVNTRTDLITTDEFIDYAISMTSSAKDIPATFDASDTSVPALDYTSRGIPVLEYAVEVEDTVETIVKD